MVQYVKERSCSEEHSSLSSPCTVILSYCKALTSQQNSPATDQTKDASFHVPK